MKNRKFIIIVLFSMLLCYCNNNTEQIKGNTPSIKLDPYNPAGSIWRELYQEKYARWSASPKYESWKISETEIVEKIVDVYEQPDNKTKVIGQINRGAYCSILEKGSLKILGNIKDYWYKISFYKDTIEKEGWIFGANTSLSKNKDCISIADTFCDYAFDEKNNMDYFNKIMKKANKKKIRISENIHVENTMDTIETIYWGSSYISVFKNEFRKEPILIEALVKDNNIVLRNNLKIGSGAEETFNLFKIKYDNKKTYKLLKIYSPGEETGFESSLMIYFDNNKIEEITYYFPLD